MTKNAMTLQRQIALKCVVDTLLGYEGAVDIGEDYEPILDDNYIREFASMMPIGRLWWVLPVNDCILAAIDCYNQSFSQFGIPNQKFAPEEIRFMRDDFTNRFVKKIKRYAGGKRLSLKVLDDNSVGFRWE